LHAILINNSSKHVSGFQGKLIVLGLEDDIYIIQEYIGVHNIAERRRITGC